jgi:hypothetical protein
MRQIEVINQETIIDVTAETSNVEILVRDYDSELVERFALEAQEAAIEAEESADIATAQASIATAQATIATTQAGIATTQAGIATTQSQIATTKANEASASAASALASEQAADADRIAAQAAASTATTQAGIATTQAGIATTKSGEASDSAFAALASETDAETAASTATTQAGIATTKAQEAAASAQEAQDIVDSITPADLTEATSSVLTITGGTDAVLGSGTTIQVKQAGSSQSGFLSSTDWTTFNSKQDTITNPVTGTGVSGQVAFWNGTSSQTADNGLFWDATNDRLGVGTNAPTNTLDVLGTVRLKSILGYNTVNIQNSGTGGLYLVSNSANSAYMSAGAEFNGAWIARAASAILFGAFDGNVRIYGNTGLTTGNTFTPTERFSVFGSSGNVGINQTTDAGFRLDVNGTARVQGVLTTTADAVVNGVSVGRGGGNISTNTRVGLNSLPINTSGSKNTAIGNQALQNNTEGSDNTAIGNLALQLMETGSGNIGIGTQAGRIANSAGTSSIFIGNFSQAGGNNRTNQIVIGNSISGLGSNTTLIGNTSTTFGRWYGSLLLGTTTNRASSILTMESTTQGFLPPRMTTTERNAIASPATGLVVYDTTLNKLSVFTGATWETVTSL